MALHLSPADRVHRGLLYQSGKHAAGYAGDQGAYLFRGVASCIYEDEPKDVFQYGDIGVLLARAVRQNRALQAVRRYPAAETIRATVVGAGTHTQQMLAAVPSAIQAESCRLKTFRFRKVPAEEERNRQGFRIPFEKAASLWDGWCAGTGCHRFSGDYHTTFCTDSGTCPLHSAGAEEIIKGPHPLILVIENDIATGTRKCAERTS